MNVWKNCHIYPPAALTIPILTCQDYYNLSSDSKNFGIVGFGPKGFYAFASLQKELANSYTTTPARLHLFNSHRFFAAGPNYSPDQPEYLLINYSIEHINAWTESEMDDPDKLPFLEWVAKYALSDYQPKMGDFASRALVGVYLQDAMRIVLEKLPRNIEVFAFQGEVTGCRIEDDSQVSLELDHIAFHPEIRYENVILTTGHAFPNPEPKNLKHNPFFVNGVYPVQSWLQSITNEDRVAIDGLGLTFVDVVLALTEGKGGEFIEENGQMTYRPSGLEPKEIFAFSRSGIPMIPRSGKSPELLKELEFFNQKVADRLNQFHGQIDFERDILPLIIGEMEVIWNLTLVESAPQKKDQFGLFNYEKLVNPLPEECFSSGEFYHTEMVNLTDCFLKDLEKEPSKSLIQQISALWRRLLPMISSCYNFKGFTPESKKRFESYYLGKFNQISFGPPEISMKKINTLSKKGILNYRLGRSPKLELNENKKFDITSSENGFSTSSDYLIQARIPKNQFPHRNSSLYEDLFKRGLASSQNLEKTSNCPEINRHGQLISRAGLVISQITLYGTPTEGMTLDNDSLSRSRNDFGGYWSSEVLKKLESTHDGYSYDNSSTTSFITKTYRKHKTMDQQDSA